MWTGSTGVYSSLQLQTCSTWAHDLFPPTPHQHSPELLRALTLFYSTAACSQHSESPAATTPQPCWGTPSREQRMSPATDPPPSQAGCHIPCPMPSRLQGFWQVGWIAPTATAALTQALSHSARNVFNPNMIIRYPCFTYRKSRTTACKRLTYNYLTAAT